MDGKQSASLGKIQLSRELEITPLAAESLGVRSLATHIKTLDTSILIDPGVALGFRDQYHPHPTEYRLLETLRKQIIAIAQSADLIVVSHFHHDHFMPFFENYAYFWSTQDDAELMYSKKRVWCKDIRKRINYSQQGRGYNFMRKVRKIAQEVVYADGKATKSGETLIRFSPAVPHGESGTKLGWVIMTAIRCGSFSMVQASDVQGPMVKETAEWIIKQKPDVLILAGPPTYLSPERVSSEVLSSAGNILGALTEQIPMTIVDHHLLRDKEWYAWLSSIQQRASKKGNQVMTVAEVLGLEYNLLEANRKDLYQNQPPSSAFKDWVKQIKNSRIRIQPPIEG